MSRKRTRLKRSRHIAEYRAAIYRKQSLAESVTRIRNDMLRQGRCFYSNCGPIGI